MTWCPDCGQDVPAAAFVEHRETVHPPQPIILAPAGIQSEARFGTDPKE